MQRYDSSDLWQWADQAMADNRSLRLASTEIRNYTQDQINRLHQNVYLLALIYYRAQRKQQDQ